MFVHLIGRKAQELRLSPQNVSPREVLADEESGINVDEITLLVVLGEVEDVVLDETPETRLQVVGREHERVAVFVDEGFGFGAPAHFVHVEGDPACKASSSEGTDEGDDGDDDGDDVDCHFESGMRGEEGNKGFGMGLNCLLLSEICSNDDEKGS